MTLPKMGDFTDDFTALPTVVSGQAEQMKAKFNSRGEDLKIALNALADALGAVTDGASGADNVGATPITSLGAAATLQTILEALAPMTTQGDIMYQGVSAPARLEKGTVGQVLQMNAEATAPAWGTPATVPDASATAKGIVELATDAEVTAGTSTTLAVTPAGAKVELDKKALATVVAAHEADFMAHGIGNAGFHNSIYRGEYLGTSVTAAQYTAISSGTFTDLYIGDYWTIGGVNYRIAAFNYYLQKGDTATTVNHITLVSDTNLYTYVMNDTNITTGGYIGSKMYTEGLEQAKTTIKNAFSGHVLNHRKALSNATVDGKASGWAWVDSEIDLMNEVMVYGSIVWGESAIGGSGYNVGEGMSQLPLFASRPDMISNRQSFWLRDVVSATYFANVNSSGHAGNGIASGALGVRPAFSIS